MEDFKIRPTVSEGNVESMEKRKFTVEEIQQLLKTIDGKERTDLVITERAENIKGELIYMVFTSAEKEIKEGKECRTSYLLTLPGQRYKSDGTVGRMITRTSLERTFPDDEFWAEQAADYIDGKWTNLCKI